MSSSAASTSPPPSHGGYESRPYVTAAALSAALMVGLLLIGMAQPLAGALAALAGFLLRGLAIRKGWSLPGYRD